LPSSLILPRTGFKRGMSLGLLIMMLGALVFIPAARGRSYGLFLAGLFTIGMGLALLQTAVNPYISVIGPIQSAAKRISIMGICNKVAGVLSPLVLGAIVLAQATQIEERIKAATDPAVRRALLEELSGRVIVPYAVMALVLALLALMVRFSPLPDIDAEESGAAQAGGESKHSVWQFPHLLLGVVCIFVYVGVEVLAGDAIGLYGKRLGLPLEVTKNLTSWTLSSMVVGYVIGILAIPRYLKQETALALSAVVGLLFSAGAYLAGGTSSVRFVALLGLANALMWPAIFPMAIDGLGRFTKTGSALLIMGIAGGAVIPKLYGALSGQVSPQAAFLVCTLPCYLYILFYATRGHRAGRAAVG
jgi:FHS family L-fucose permease-like MFS transporter